MVASFCKVKLWNGPSVKCSRVLLSKMNNQALPGWWVCAPERCFVYPLLLPLQFSYAPPPTPTAWNGSSSKSAWHSLIHLRGIILSLACPPKWRVFPDKSLFPFSHLQLMLVTSEYPALSDTPGHWSYMWSGGWLCVCHVTDLGVLTLGSLPTVRMNFRIWRSVFKGGRRGCSSRAATILMLIETWACLGHQPQQSWKCHTFQGLSSCPGFGLCNFCLRLTSALHTSQTSPT